MISQTAEYALRAMVFLAMKDSAATGQEIAAVTLVPSGYLSKIMQQLAKAKLVHSQRGIGGGFTLARQAEAISILDIVNAVDPIKHIKSCPLDIKSHGVNLCPLHARLSTASRQVEEAFAKSTLAELIAESRSPDCVSVPLTPRLSDTTCGDCRS